MDHTASSPRRAAWPAAQTSTPPASPHPVTRESKGQSGDRAGRVVVVVDPATVVRTTEANQTLNAEAAREIRRSLAQLRKLLALQTRAREIDDRFCFERQTCRARAPRCLVPLGGCALLIAGGVTNSVPMVAVGATVAICGEVHWMVAPCTVGEGFERLWLCMKIEAHGRDDLWNPSDVQRRMDGLEAAERMLRPNAIAFEVREATPLPAALAAIVGEYADVDPDPAPQEPASFQTTAPPQDQSMS